MADEAPKWTPEAARARSLRVLAALPPMTPDERALLVKAVEHLAWLWPEPSAWGLAERHRALLLAENDRLRLRLSQVLDAARPVLDVDAGLAFDPVTLENACREAEADLGLIVLRVEEDRS